LPAIASIQKKARQLGDVPGTVVIATTMPNAMIFSMKSAPADGAARELDAFAWARQRVAPDQPVVTKGVVSLILVMPR